MRQADAGRLEEAHASLRKALDLDPGLMHAWLSLAMVCARMERLDEAKEVCRQALARDPGSLGVQLYLVLFEHQEGQEAETLRQLERLLRHGKNHADLRFHVGRLLALLERRSEALDQLRKAVALNAEHFPAQLLRVGLCIETRRLREAEDALAQLMDVLPEEAEIWADVARF